MRAESVVNNCNLYLSGFKDVWAHKTACSTLMGIGKIFSYVLGITTGVALALRCYYTKVLKKEALLENQAALKADTIFKKINQVEPQTINQEELVEFLAYKASKVKKEETNEIATFQKAFRLLTPGSQYKFFKEISSKYECMKNALDLIPRDIEEINFVCGSKSAEANTSLFVGKLAEFTKIKCLNLDLRGLGHFGPKEAHAIRLMNTLGGKAKELEVEGNGYTYSNGRVKIEGLCDAVMESLFHLREVIRKNNDLEYQIDFTNIGISNHGIRQFSGIFEDDNHWPLLICTYLDSVKSVG